MSDARAQSSVSPVMRLTFASAPRIAEAARGNWGPLAAPDAGTGPPADHLSNMRAPPFAYRVSVLPTVVSQSPAQLALHDVTLLTGRTAGVLPRELQNSLTCVHSPSIHGTNAAYPIHRSET